MERFAKTSDTPRYALVRDLRDCRIRLTEITKYTVRGFYDNGKVPGFQARATILEGEPGGGLKVGETHTVFFTQTLIVDALVRAAIRGESEVTGWLRKERQEDAIADVKAALKALDRGDAPFPLGPHYWRLVTD